MDNQRVKKHRIPWCHFNRHGIFSLLIVTRQKNTKRLLFPFMFLQAPIVAARNKLNTTVLKVRRADSQLTINHNGFIMIVFPVGVILMPRNSRTIATRFREQFTVIE